MNHCETIRYRHQRDYFTGDKHYFLEGDSFIDFTSTDSIVGLKYQVQSEKNFFFFNGTETFLLDKNNKTLQLTKKPTKNDLEGGSFFYNSIISLRRTLPLIIADKQITKHAKDTIMDKEAFYLIRFSLHKKNLNPFGGYFPITEDRTFSFQLVINKNNFLPVMLVQTNNADEHISKITYTQIKMNTQVAEHSWYYSTYLPEFTMVSAKKELALLNVGAPMPAFELPLFSSDQTVSSHQFKNRLLLIEFWIRNCGPCIESVPKLNSIYEKYKDRGLEVLAINSGDARPTVAYFVQKYGPRYAVAYRGEQAAEKFGVFAFPSVFLLRNGDIIYSGSFDPEAIAQAIEKTLNNTRIPER